METYKNWMDQITKLATRHANSLALGSAIKSTGSHHDPGFSSKEHYGVIEFVQISKPSFMVEIGKKGSAYIYHFYPSTSVREKFYDYMSEALLEIFKRGDQIEADWVDEMDAWAVRVLGWTDNIWGDDLAVRAIDRLQEIILEKFK